MRRKQSPGFATSWLRFLLLSLFCTPLSQIANQAYGQSQDPDALHAMVNAGFERIRLSEKAIRSMLPSKAHKSGELIVH